MVTRDAVADLPASYVRSWLDYNPGVRQKLALETGKLQSFAMWRRLTSRTVSEPIVSGYIVLYRFGKVPRLWRIALREKTAAIFDVQGSLKGRRRRVLQHLLPDGNVVVARNYEFLICSFQAGNVLTGKSRAMHACFAADARQTPFLISEDP